jgi:hypothetical protein
MLALNGEAYPKGWNVLGVWAWTDVYYSYLISFCRFLLVFVFSLRNLLYITALQVSLL